MSSDEDTEFPVADDVEVTGKDAAVLSEWDEQGCGHTKSRLPTLVLGTKAVRHSSGSKCHGTVRRIIMSKDLYKTTSSTNQYQTYLANFDQKCSIKRKLVKFPTEFVFQA